MESRIVILNENMELEVKYIEYNLSNTSLGGGWCIVVSFSNELKKRLRSKMK